MKTKLIIFGITGDLSRRKLLPVLNGIVERGDVQELSILGVSRRDVDVRQLVTESTGSDSLVSMTSVFTMSLDNADDYVRLKEHVALQEDEQALVYLSVPPTTVADIVDYLGKAGMNGKNVKILFEKPFGIDLASAKSFVERTGAYFEESQMYRIDHYAAKEIAQEVVRVRTADDAARTWGNGSIEAVDIIASEKIGIEGRGIFYEETGALRDFVQGHLMQLLALVLMDMHEPFDTDHLAERRYKALERIEPAVPADTVRAQYDGYREEAENPGSTTETFVSMPLVSNDPQWHGVPLRLTTGKSLDQKRSAIIIRYKDGSKQVFEEGKPMDEQSRIPDAYERIFLEAIAGNKHLFTTSPEILRSWEIVTPVQEAWKKNQTPLKTYAQGSSIDQILG